MRLITRLLRLQEAHGYLTEDLLRQAARDARVPLYRVQGLVSFYPHFRATPAPRQEIAVCRDMACWLADPNSAERVRAEHACDAGVEVREVSCLGRCDSAPAIVAVDEAASFVNRNEAGSFVYGPWRCDPYASAAERYALLREFLKLPREQAADRLIAALKESGLRGMGGAGFPTGAKWELVRGESRTPKHVICNADESEPGPFKDRVILAELPHLVIEGMILAGLAAGSAHGIL